jgi:excisionase family DNA binding protein
VPAPHGIELSGDYYLVPGWALARLHRDPRSGLNDYRRTVRGEDHDLDAVLRGMCLAAIHHDERHQVAARGQVSADTSATAPPSTGRLTTAQAAEELRLSPRTVRRHVAEGRLRADRDGYAYSIDRDELDRYRRAS